MKIPSPRLSRDAVLLISGLAGIAHETLTRGAERPTLLILFAAMIGLPAFLHADEDHSRKKIKRPRPPDEKRPKHAVPPPPPAEVEPPS